jgi:LacI family transcriptional regulator
MATIKDVAKAAGVSISTVSYAMNDDPRIPAVTADRVRRIADDIGYYPSAAARNLKKRSTGTILVAISDFGGPVYAAFLDGIHHGLQQHGYTMIVATGRSSVSLLGERSADGAIVADIHITDELVLKTAMNATPTVVVDRELEGENVRSMTLANTQAMAELTAASIARGYRRIAYVHGVRGTFDNATRYAGFLRAMQGAGLTPFAEYQGSFTKPSGRALLDGLLASEADLPEMFVCANDEMAIGIMDGLLAAGKRIPGDIGVSGFDDIELAQYYRPGLSTIRIDHDAWGRAIADAVVGLIRNVPVAATPQIGTVIIRDSF